MNPVLRKVVSFACALFFWPGMPAHAAVADAPLKLSFLKNADGTLGLSASAAAGTASVSQPAPLRAALWNGALDTRRPAPSEWRYDKGPDPKTTGAMRVAGGKIILSADFSKGGKRYVAAVCPVALPDATQASFTVKAAQRHLITRLVDATGQRHQQTHNIEAGASSLVTVPFGPSPGSLSWGGADDDILHLPLRAIEILASIHDADDTGAATVEISGMRFVNENIPAPATLQGGYATLSETAAGEWLGTGELRTPGGGATLAFTDRWTVAGGTLRLRREVRVRGDAPGGFGTVAALRVTGAKPWPQMEWFAPGMIYGNFDHMRDNSFGSGNYYKPGDYTVWIREDRMPAPLLAARLPAGETVAVLNSAPDGATTAAEGHGFTREPMTGDGFRFGAILAEERADGTALGYAFPGSEGTLSYGRKTGAGPETAQQWRHRFHPLKDGFVQRYEVSFRLDRASDTNDLVARSWRWAWETLKPQVNPQDIETLRGCLVDVLAENFIESGDRAGVQFLALAVPGGKPHPNPKTILGFTGYALGSAEMMLVEATRDPASLRGRELRRKAEKSIAAILRLPMSPPTSEGFLLKTGDPALSTWPVAKKITENQPIYLRSFCDDMKSLMRAYEREARAGHPRPEWLAWVRQFGDWLLTQEQPGGGFPRAWRALSGKLLDASTTGTFNVVPFYAQLYRITGYKSYLDAALRSGEFAWDTGHAQARFTGGTIDNPDVIDKEAATLSLEGYLALHDTTRDKKWLARARAAADAAETWMYIWDIPMPADADGGKLHWKRGQSTVGIQLIATGHSLNDAYMCWDVESYARLFRETGDAHYLEVARILLHNTKAMVGRPGDLRGTRGPGWQQEHWCFTIPRGIGRHREWLPWVTVSHLRGINDLMDYDPALYRELAGK
ncbi:MAG: hypothetical protein LBM92_03565 [Opitutaceae bacterium]|jgi:hypothetical protein|nr:hypothetical protein [Opitutaceae bacterium]